jgi:hypothetical protein
MAAAREVQVSPLSLERMRGLIDPGDRERLETGLGLGRSPLAGRLLSK